MNQQLCVKGRILGDGRPLICVPVMAENQEEIIRDVKRLVRLRTDMIEWRVDAFSGADSLNAIREVLKELAPHIKDTIFAYTFRSGRQGGLREMDPDRIYDIRQVAAETSVVDFVDVEVFECKKPQREIRQLQEMGVHIIASHHDFEQTPDRKIIQMILEQIHESGADVVKLAMMPQNPQDVLNLLEETHAFHARYPNQPLITMSMGALGSISRVAGEFFGSCVTFGAGEKSSAPGQLPMEELEEVLNIMHKSIGADA